MGQAPEPLGTFLEMMLHNYQIENVVSYIFSNKDNNIGGAAASRAASNPLG